MCGRYSSTKAPKDLADEFRAVDATDGAKVADFNVAPTKQVVAVVERHPRDEEGTPDPDRVERSLRMLRWGLVPSWSKDPSGGARMINARTETAAQKPAFRRALKTRRCILPADGWYEWQRGPQERVLHSTSSPTSPTTATAARSPWPGCGSSGSPRTTRRASTPTAWSPARCSPRTPSGPSRRCTTGCRWCCPPSAWEAWLDPDRTPDDEAVAALLAPPSPELVEQMELRPVSPRVNNVRNNGPELLEALPPEQVAEPLQLDLLAGPNPQ